MSERRKETRERVIFGATAKSGEDGPSRKCVVKNFSTRGALIDFVSTAKLPKQLALTIERKGRSYQAQVMWSRERSAGVAFDESPKAKGLDNSGLEERLRLSEKKARQLRRRVRELSGEA